MSEPFCLAFSFGRSLFLNKSGASLEFILSLVEGLQSSLSAKAERMDLRRIYPDLMRKVSLTRHYKMMEKYSAFIGNQTEKTEHRLLIYKTGLEMRLEIANYPYRNSINSFIRRLLVNSRSETCLKKSRLEI